MIFTPQELHYLIVALADFQMNVIEDENITSNTERGKILKITNDLLRKIVDMHVKEPN